MSYEIVFREDAEKEWRKLDASVRQQFAKKLKERGCYKIKLRRIGYRLVYEVDDGRIVIVVVAIGKRDKNDAYDSAISRMER